MAREPAGPPRCPLPPLRPCPEAVEDRRADVLLVPPVPEAVTRVWALRRGVGDTRGRAIQEGTQGRRAGCRRGEGDLPYGQGLGNRAHASQDRAPAGATRCGTGPG